MRAGRASRPRTAIRGFTLVEFLVALTVIAIVSVAALPSFDDFRARQQLRGAAESVHADLVFARSEAIQRNGGGAERLRVSFGAGGGWCYGIHDPTRPGAAATCDCASGPAACSVKAVSSAEYRGVQMDAVDFGGGAEFEIDPRLGQLVDAGGAPVGGSVLLSVSAARQLRVDVNALGRVRICSPDGGVAGYPSC